MNSFISAFKVFRPLLLALGGLLLIELTCLALVPQQLALFKAPLLHMAYRIPIQHQRVFAVAKLDRIMELNGTIIQVGDSSGLLAIRPSIIDSYLPNGLRLLNLSMQLPAQFRGFEATAERGLTEHPDAKYLMVVVTPYLIGRDDPGFGEVLWRDYAAVPVWRWFHSLSLRAFVTNLVYYGVLSPSGIYLPRGPSYPEVSDLRLRLRIPWRQPMAGGIGNCRRARLHLNVCFQRMSRSGFAVTWKHFTRLRRVIESE